MTLFQRLMFETLSGYSGVSAMIGARVYPDIAPQGVAKPYMVWQEFTLQQANDLGGSVVTGGLDNYHVQVTSWAVSGTMSRELDKQARLAMIVSTGFKSLLNDFRSLPYEPDTKLFGAQSDFSVWVKS